MEDNPPIEYSDSLYSLATFRDVFGTLAIPSRTSGERALPKGETEHKLSERDIEVLVRWLSRDAGVVVTDGKVSPSPSNFFHIAKSSSRPARGANGYGAICHTHSANWTGHQDHP